MVKGRIRDMVNTESLKNAAEQCKKADDNLIAEIFNFVLRITDDGTKKIKIEGTYVEDFGVLNELSIGDYTNLLVSWSNDESVYYGEDNIQLLNECDINIIRLVADCLLNGRYKVVEFEESDFGINKL